MSSQRPRMLINLPPPPSDPTTPNEQGPGTPNSTTTSLSTLSVVAIKDGLVGHSGRGPGHSANTLEAERADRISRLAGLERVATVRSTSSGNIVPAGSSQLEYAIPHIRERSTVGSASATGSVGGRTTWASESVDNDPDKMSEDQDDGTSSTGGFSDEDKSSLVGFGEGANSTVSGPVSTANARMLAARQNLAYSTAPKTPQQSTGSGQSTPMSGVFPTGSATGGDSRTMDGITYDQNMAEPTVQTPQTATQSRDPSGFSGFGTEMAEDIMKDRIDEPTSNQVLSNDGRNLGRFGFERDGQ